ncbi:hypothetical protein CEXT_431281 [Caerostris extrusa]|uniref:Uncharacterized protein n=1 Tax=Caerostris extrusa TaxID=172846 RepID=A0AAV4XF02_CAEEX|nr:hypothetical protein CEXT_431281 [Caerostris extrusa]
MINKRALLQKEQCVLLPANPVRFIKLTAKDATAKKKEKKTCLCVELTERMSHKKEMFLKIYPFSTSGLNARKFGLVQRRS